MLNETKQVEELPAASESRLPPRLSGDDIAVKDGVLYGPPGMRFTDSQEYGTVAVEARPAAAYVMCMTLPLQTHSLNKHGKNWQARHRVTKQLRGDTLLLLRQRKPPTLPCTIRMCRIAPSSGLDEHDNLPGSLKPIADGICDWLGVKSDRDKRITWALPSQKRGEYGVEVIVEADL